MTDKPTSPEDNDAAAPAPLSRRKQLFFFVVLGLLLLIFAEASLQLFYRASVGRWLWEWWAVPIYQEDPIRGYRLKSNLDFLHQTREFTARYRTDAEGLRVPGDEPPVTVEKPDDVFRILALGPSFAFGWAVNDEDSYVRLIARQLRVPGKRVELINLGTPSQAQSLQLRWLRETGHRYQPDLILQTVYADLTSFESDDKSSLAKPVVKDGYLYMTPMTWTKRVRLWSATLFYGWHVYHNLIGSRQLATGDGRELHAKDRVADDTELLRKYQAYEKFVHTVATNRPTVVFLYVPLAYAVRPSDVGRFNQRLDPQVVRRRAAEITRFFNTNGVHLLDPTEALIQKDQSERTYFLYDIHFTPAGNKAVSEYALPFLQSLVTPENPPR
jgi:hypothetical protein